LKRAGTGGSQPTLEKEAKTVGEQTGVGFRRVSVKQAYQAKRIAIAEANAQAVTGTRFGG